MDIPPIPDGSLRAKFAAVAGYDSTVRVLSLNPGEGCERSASKDPVAARICLAFRGEQ